MATVQPEPPPSPLLPPPPSRGGAADPIAMPPAGRDPEFDPILPDHALELDHSPESYQRLLTNPFLGIAAILAWLAGMFALIFQGFAGPFTLMAVLLMLASLGLVPGLFQYHCLDCGKVGRLSEWRRHLCPSVAERRIEGRRRVLRGPTPPVQVILWLWALMLLFVLAHVLGLRLPSSPDAEPTAPPGPSARAH